MPCDFWSWVLKGYADSPQFSWTTHSTEVSLLGPHSRNPAAMLWKAKLGRGQVLAPVDGPAEPSLGVISAQAPHMWIKKPPDDFSPQPFKAFPAFRIFRTRGLSHGREMSSICYVLSKFLIHKTCGSLSFNVFGIICCATVDNQTK